jgi:tetratricopeptide (TPR) repeat protein
MVQSALSLEVAEFGDTDHWRFVLKEAGGAFLADHSVALDRADQHYAALVDLPGYLRVHSAPDTRAADEQRLLGEVGGWIGEQVLGRTIAEKLLSRARPSVVVRVLVPPAAERVLALPLEIARLDSSEPLSVQGVSFVFETTGTAPPPAQPVGERLRILALFSLPPAGSPLNLRRERQMLRALVRQLVGAAGLGVELHVLQYGVTRASLQDVLQQGEGWDVIHFSGHGQPGALLLERADGRPDEVSSIDLAKLLRQAGGRVKLVTLSACLSAAASIAQTLSWLGISEGEAAKRDAPPTGEQATKATPTVARALTEALDCAVLAMRYAVEDEFAANLARELYDRLFRQKQPLPQATRLALTSAAGAAGVGVLSTAAPALFGPRAADLTLVPPRRPGIDTDTSLAFVRKEPEHFVGRVSAMTRASAALAAESDRSGALFHGMAGAGKTSCAVELVYHHAAVGRFQAFVWYSAPEQGKDIALALRDLAVALERQIPDLAMLQVIDRADALRDWLPRLAEVLEKNAFLIVLDNLESLLTEAGAWRDERWGLLAETLLTPGGLSRTVLTSRTRPATLTDSVEVIAVHALPRDEALLLVRELPNLRRLLDGAPQTGMRQEAGGQLVRRMLRLVQGHPKLIELAEALAAQPAKLAAQLDEADKAQTDGTGELDAFFAQGETRLDAAAFMASLHGWTRGIASALPEAARTFFHFLCALEEGDRQDWIIEMNWSDVWQRLGRPAPTPILQTVLDPLTASGLVDKQAMGEEAEAFEVLIHPGVAEAGRADFSPDLQAAVDNELGATWVTLAQNAWEVRGRETSAGPTIARAGLHGFPYLARLGEWHAAAMMLEKTVRPDSTTATIGAVLPLVQQLVAATAGTEREAKYRSFLARVLRFVGRIPEAETLMRELIAQTAVRGEFATASATSGDLAYLLMHTGRLRNALGVLEQKAEYAKQAGHGAWAQLLDECQRLQIQNALGEHSDVLARVMELRKQMPDPPEANDWSVDVWTVRETMSDIGREAAVRLEEWQLALEFNAELIESKEKRGAGALEIASYWINDNGPLLGLRRYNDARKLLLRCRDAFEQENAAMELGLVFGGLADLEDKLGRSDAAQRFGQAAIRYNYAAGTTANISISHFNLSIYLAHTNGDWREVLGHRLAAAMISGVTGSGGPQQDIASFARDLRQAGDQASAALPGNFAALCAAVQQVEGVRFGELMQRLQPDEALLNQLLQDIIANAKAQDQGEGQ